MTAHLTEIWRHPIKAIGRERVARAHLSEGQCLPWDRHWAVAHEKARIEGDGWAHCANFLRAAGNPALMAVRCELDEAAARLRLTHPERPPLILAPDEDPAPLLDWLAPLVAEGRPGPAFLHRAGRGQTDSAEATLTLCSHASHRALEQRLGRKFSTARWRGNLWIEGLAPWEEFDWLDRELRLGSARLRVISRTTRCRATEANPETGRRDTDILALLDELGHRDFSVKAVVVGSGDIAEGDELEIL